MNKYNQNFIIKNSKLFTFFVLVVFIIFISVLKTEAQNLVACLDQNGNIVDTVYTNEVCPAGSTSGSTFFINQNTNNTNTNNSVNTNTVQNSTPITQQQVQQTQTIPAYTQSPTQTISTTPEVIINNDPSLAYGPFTDLDPTDYKYCVLLSHDLLYESRDIDTGNDVSALQLYLTDRGFLETGATGYFGRATDLAVKKFQYRNQISVSGIVDSSTRDIVKELTCEKYQKVSYIDKPLSPAPKKIKNTTTVKKVATIKTVKKPTTVIPTTNSNSVNNNTSYTSVSTPISNTVSNNTAVAATSMTLNNNKLSSQVGSMSLSSLNNLYFTFSTNSSNPTICMNINNVNCSVISNNISLVEGVKGNIYEAANLSGKWSFTIYGNSSWGSAGNKVYIYLKDNSTSNILSIYTINIVN